MPVTLSRANRRRPPKIVRDMKAELAKPNFDPSGWPLPVASSWETGYTPWQRQYAEQPTPIDVGGSVNTPAWQMQLIRRGHHWLPVFVWPLEIDNRGLEVGWDPSYYGAEWDQLGAWEMPFTLLSQQWEQQLVWRSDFSTLPEATNPLNVALGGGSFGAMLDPLGAASGTAWYDCGILATTGQPVTAVYKELNWDDLSTRHPNPPKLLLLSNNESPRMTALTVELSQRWVDAYGTEQTTDFKNEKLHDGWVVRYNQMFDGMRDGLAIAPAWQKKAILVGYDNNFIGAFGRYSGWPEYSDYFPGHLVTRHLYWDGGTPSYYMFPGDTANGSDRVVQSPQVEFMNVKFGNDLAWAENPQYWYEFSVWDGWYDSPTGYDRRSWYAGIGDPFTPKRYKAWIRYGMWLTKPRVVREYRENDQFHEDIGPDYTRRLLEAVDEVWENETLTRFWRFGTVVANTARDHPYQSAIPAAYASTPRWYNLDTSLDPATPWSLTTEIPVWALALVNGTAPNREWLVYAYAPGGDRDAVTITIPGYGDITIDVPMDGTFVHLEE